MTDFGAPFRVYCSGANVTINKCTFSGKNAGSASAIRNEGTLTVTNSTFTNNVSDNSSGLGATIVNLGTATIQFCTIAGNTSAVTPAGLLSTGTSLSLSDTIIFNDNATDIVINSSSVSGSSNLIGRGSDSRLTGTITADPLLRPLAYNGGQTYTLALATDSPAVDAGVAISGLNTDQRGVSRPQGASPDIGAYESNPLRLVVNTTDDPAGYNSSITPGQLGSTVTLRDAVNAAGNIGGDVLITFAPALAGQSISLRQLAQFSDGRSALATGSARSDIGALYLTIQGIKGNSGVTISRSGPAMRLIANSGVLPGSLTLNDLTLSGGNPVLDASGGDGGAISSLSGYLALNRSTLTNNSGRAGAIYLSNCTAKLTNCTVANNQSSDVGGGISGGPLTLINSTIAENQTRFGGGIASSAPLLINTIVANNSTQLRNSEIDGTVSTSSYNNLTTASGGTNDSAGGLVNGVNGNIVGRGCPLGALASNGGPTQTCALLTGNPAINAGSANGAPATDQRGIARAQGNSYDIGALEARLPVMPSVANANLNHLSTDLPFDLLVASGASPAGGVFSGTGVSGNSFYPANAALGANSVSYSFTSADNVSLSALITITVTQAPIVSWRSLQGLPSNGSQDLANPSGDGIANLIKYAFNLAPNAGDLNQPNVTILPENGTAGLPFYIIDGSGRLVVEFVRRKASTNPGITYIVQVGSDLTSWNALDLTGASVVSIDETFERVTATDPTVASKRFGRVRLESLPVYSNDFNNAPGAITLRGSAAWFNQGIQLTDEQHTGQSGAVVFNGINTGPQVTGFNASFTVGLGFATSNVPADGISFAVGDLGSGSWGEGGGCYYAQLGDRFGYLR